MKQWQKIVGEDLLNEILEQEDISAMAEGILKKLKINKSVVREFSHYRTEGDKDSEKTFKVFWESMGYL